MLKKNNLLSGALLIGLIVLLCGYVQVVNLLPSVIYSTSQQEFLTYNEGRKVSQAPLYSNMIVPTPVWGSVRNEDGTVNNSTTPPNIQPASFAHWENRVQAKLAGRYEEKNGVSVTVYDLDFQSEYQFQYRSADPSGLTTTLELIFPFPSNLETLHDVRFLVDGREPIDAQYTPQKIRWTTLVTSGDKHKVAISYQADGASSFSYGLTQDRRTDALAVTITVAGLTDSHIAPHSLPPTTSDSQTFGWNYTNLVADRDIQLILPKQLSFTQRVAALQDYFILLGFLAPFLVGLFLAALASLLNMARLRLSLPEYLLTGIALVFFYPLLTFLSGMVDVLVAAALAGSAIFLLLLAFLGALIGWRTIVWQLIWLIFVFFGVLSMGLLTPWQGLLLTIGGLLVSGTFMLAYAKRPAEVVENLESKAVRFAEPEKSPESPPNEVKEIVKIAEPLPETEPMLFEATPFWTYCPQCGRGQMEDYDFCPGCGYDGRVIQQCGNCGHQQMMIPGTPAIYCLHCGKILE